MKNAGISGYRIEVRQVLWIVFFWTFISIFEYLLQYAIIIFLNVEFNAEQAWRYLILNILAGALAGLLGGSVLVFVWNKWLRTISYGRALISIFISFSAIYFAIYGSINFISAKLDIFPSTNDMFLEGGGFPILIQYINWLLIGLGTLFLLQVNDKYGPGMLKNFILGKYFHPKREERIFMFLDLRSSTTIAEKMGDHKYFNFLRDTYSLITPSIMKFSGEIYQYVGDEIVISWSAENHTAFTDSIACFFEINTILDSNVYFKDRYNEQPVFKAGIHGGNVIAGEMGIIKREIAYSGDVLNTASRIQESCNRFGTNILISEYIERHLSSGGKFTSRPIGEIVLRGKENALKLYIPEYIE